MNVHISYRLSKLPAVEKDVQHQIEKLQKRLQVFRPDLIHLKGVVEEISAREGTSVSLNLRLPSGQMAVQSKAPTAAAAVKVAFEDLLQQVKKHKDLLRASHKWQRGRRGNTTRPGAPVREVPFEQTIAAVFPATISGDDIRSYVNANLSRLDRFVEREIYFREAQDSIAPGSVSKEEVIDEAIAVALSDGQEKPEKLALEPWLYRQALRALDDSRAPTKATAMPSIWKIPRAAPTSKAATNPACSFISPMNPLLERRSLPTLAFPRPSRSLLPMNSCV